MSGRGHGGEPPITAVLSSQEAEQQRFLEFHLAELERLRERGLIAAEVFDTVAAETRSRRALIEQKALARAELEGARRLSNKDPRAALELAERARRTDPTDEKPWSLALDLRIRLGDDDGAIALCEEAHAAFPGFKVPVDQLRREAAQRAAARAEAANQAKPFPLTRVREAVERGDDDSAVALCVEQLARQPNHHDAMVILAAARQRQGRLANALELYRRLYEMEPANPSWTKAMRAIEQKLNPPPVVPPVAPRKTPAAFPPAAVPPVAPRKDPAAFPPAAVAPVARREEQITVQPPVAAAPAPAPREPRISWSNIAQEFLQEHWQKLMLALAMLLIVVGSNVGAYQLLGPTRFFSDISKCVLALVYTAMFAGFGAGLSRWGAARTGRIMLLITLIVAPANFMLDGQISLLTAPTPLRLAVLIGDVAALFVLIKVVTSALGLGRAAGFLSTALFVLGAFSVAASPGSTWPWAWQFAVYLAPAAVFLGSVVRLTTREQGEPPKGRAETLYFALGMLAFVFVTGAIRTGVFILALAPTLHALPVMTAAIACVFLAARLDRFDPDPRRKQWARFAGLVLSGLAMAMAMARPPAPEALYNGNTLATALLGLALYVTLLRFERLPAYLYCGFGALVVAYFAASYFTRDLVRPVEDQVRHALGYRILPEPFRAVNGLVLSPLLAALAIYFRRVWNDGRLARHCHYLGVPFSIAACVLSAFEPKAAVVCLSGYAILYAVAVRVFRAPGVVYLAAAALAGAVFFGVTLLANATYAEEALGASLLGLAYWALAAVFRVMKLDVAYRRPLDHAALVLAALGVVGATVSIVWAPGVVSLTAAGAFLVVAVIATLVNRDEPSLWLGYMAVVCANAGLATLALAAGNRWRGGLTFAEFAVAASAIGLVCAELAGWLRKLAAKSASVFPRPLFQAAFFQTALALVLCGLHIARLAEHLAAADFTIMAAALAMAGATLASTTRRYPRVELAHATFACGLGVWVCLAQAIHGGVFGVLADYAALCAAYALGLVAVREAARAVAGKNKTVDPDFPPAWRPRLALFTEALPVFGEALVFCAAALAVAGLRNGPDAVSFTTAATFLMVATTATLLTRDEPILRLGYLAVIAGNAGLATLALASGNRWRGGLSQAEFAAAAAAIGLVCAELAGWLRKLAAKSASVFPRPLFQAAFFQTALALVLCGLHIARLAEHLAAADFTIMAAALAMAGATLASLTRRYPRVELAHATFACGLGVWVCLAQAIHGGVFGVLADYAALCAGYALGLVAVREAVRAVAGKNKAVDPDSPSTWRPRLALFIEALPVFGEALVFCAAALAVAGLRNGPDAVSFTTAATFLMVATTATLLTRDEPILRLGYLAVIAGNAGLATLALAAGNRWRGGLSQAEFAVAASAIGLVCAELAGWLRKLAAKSATVFPRPLFQAAFFQTALALVLCGLHTSRLAERLATADFTIMAAALALAGATLASLTRRYPRVELVHATFACGLGVWVCLAQAIHGGIFGVLADYAALCAAYALGLVAVREAVRAVAGKNKTVDPNSPPTCRPRLALFVESLPVFGEALILCAAALAVAGLMNRPDAVSFTTAATFLMVATTATLLTRDEPILRLGYLAVIAGNAGLATLALAAGNRWRGGLSQAEFAAAAAAIGLVCAELAGWLRKLAAKSATVFPRPLFQAAFFQTALALVLCGLHTSRLAEHLATADFTIMAAALALAGATLASLTRRYPRVELAHATLACGLGVWVCVAQAIHGGIFGVLADYGALCAGYALGLVAVREAVRAVVGENKTVDPDFPPTWSTRVALFTEALPVFGEALVVCAAALAIAGFRNGPGAVFTFAAGAISILWSTRFRREPRLVHLGLALGFAAALLLTDWRIGRSDLGFTLACLALTSVVYSFILWAVGRGSATRPGLDFYARPCSGAAALATWPVFVLALAGRVDSDRAFAVSTTALGLNALVLGLLASDRRRAVYTYRAVLSAVCAGYVVVFSLGTQSPDSGYILGLVAVLDALVLAAAGFGCRYRATDDNGFERLYAQPMFNSSLVLTVLAIAPAYPSPWTMLVVGLSFLVMVKGIPAREWLYATVGSAACAVYFAMIEHGQAERLVMVGMIAAYVLWLVGLLVRRAEPSLVAWLRLPHRDYDYPLFNSAAAACAAAVALRLSQTWDGPLPWSDSAGLALAVAGFMILMIKPYPRVEWVHAGMALASASAALAAYPRGVTAEWLARWWAPLGMALANLWWIVAWTLERWGRPITRWLGITGQAFAAAVRQWSRAFFVLTAPVVGAVVVHMVLMAFALVSWPIDSSGIAEWLAIVLAIVLGAVYMIANWWSTRQAETVLGLHGWLLLFVWWLAAPAAPLVARLGASAVVFLPLATAGFALATVAAGLLLEDRPGWRGLFRRLGAPVEDLERHGDYFLKFGLGLAMLAALMTRAQVNQTTIDTLLLATAAAGLAAVVRQSVVAGYMGSLAWCGAGLFAGLEGARRFDVSAHGNLSIIVAGGLLAALAVLWVVAGLVRRFEPEPARGESNRIPARLVSLAMEHTALFAAFAAAGLVAVSAFGFGAPSPWAALTAVVVLCGLALFAIGLIVRWGEEWLVYAAQGLILSGYFYYRWAFSVPAAADAAIFTLFGFLDLGAAEAMYHAGLQRFARPTRYFSLALPVLPLVLGLFDGGLGEMRLFFLFTAATFYAIAGLSMRWQWLGHASAILYNAFLWILWGRIGWTLSDRPQFFLIPVGLSAILFAELHRRSLGRESTNTIRGVGLTIVYLSLAVPIWRFESLGAWAALLFVSLLVMLAGIGLRVQVFLWLGLVGFVLDVVYQLGRMGMEHTLAKWAIMLALGLTMILFVALNEKKRILPTLRLYLDQARQWD